MGVKKPYFQTVRQFVDGSYANGGRSRYIEHPSYASSPSSYLRAFGLIQEDLLTIFEYIEPTEQNLSSYSLRNFELLLRTCTEVEANFKSILRANSYSKNDNFNIKDDYSKINSSHFLSRYKVKPPYLSNTGKVRMPFKGWDSQSSLSWYKAYNQVKHDKVQNLALASLEHLIDAVCGLTVVLAAQYHTNDFSPGPSHLLLEGPDFVGKFEIEFPNDLPVDERYDFEWQTLRNDNDPFAKFNYDEVEV